MTRTLGTIRAPGRERVGEVRRGCRIAWPRADIRSRSSRSRRSPDRCAGSAPPPSRGLPRRAGSASSLGGRYAVAVTPELAFQGRDVVVPRLPVPQPVQAVIAAPLLPDVGRGRDRRHPVDERPATDRGTGEQRDRAIPGREQPVVEVQPGERVQLVRRHRCLVDERPRVEDHDGTTRGRRAPWPRRRLPRRRRRPRRRRPGASVRPRRRRTAGRRHDAGPIGRRGRRRSLQPIADRRVAGIRRSRRARVGVGEEGQELAQAVEGGPPLRDPRCRPRQQHAFAVGRRTSG